MMWSSLKGGEQFMCEPRSLFGEDFFWFLWHVNDVANQTETNFMLLNNIVFLRLFAAVKTLMPQP